MSRHEGRASRGRSPSRWAPRGERSDLVTSERFFVTGVVQGVGFRPFVYRLATELGVRGVVGNDSGGVFVEATATVDLLDEFEVRLRSEAPPLAAVESVSRGRCRVSGGTDDFQIVASEQASGPRTLVPPDTAVCDDCLRELADPADRRYRHPFITCTNCGPRFTIIESLPYDRPATTMASFEMCRACRAEYNDPADRRYHAQPIACHACGPTLRFVPAGTGAAAENAQALDLARTRLEAGSTVAVKGLGGFHLAVDATNADAVARLRGAKHRPDKPLAVLVDSVERAHQLAVLDDAAVALLTSPARPVVLAEARNDSGLADEVAPGNPLVGVMLAYTPIHHLLLDGLDRPLVMTSANHSGEPIIFEDEEMEASFASFADALLTHDRPIVTPCDDSVVRVCGDQLLPIRRARGYAPMAVGIGRSTRSVLAVGGELKNTFCVTDDRHAWVSPHIGDMGSLSTIRAFEASVRRFQTLYGLDLDRVAADAHPGYATTRWAELRSTGSPLLVQHHHAHLAAVMAEHGLDPHTPVVGFVFDGTGYGSDGTIWGGEVLRADATGFERLTHLVPVPLPGGDAAIRHPARVALAHLWAAGIDWARADESGGCHANPEFSALPPVTAMSDQHRRLLHQQFRSGAACTPTTSMGRLFDAVASLIGLRHSVTFEAQAAIELEHAAAANQREACRYEFATTSAGALDQRPVIRGIARDVLAGRDPSAIADGFHSAVVAAMAGVASRLVPPGNTLVLSGGVFQNALLTTRAVARLTDLGYDVRTHRLVPPNDGGLALGQAFVAAHSAELQE